MAQIQFLWDPVKAASNAAKHGVTFDEAMGVFADPLASSIADPASPSGEERWITIGLNLCAKGARGEFMRISRPLTHCDRADNFRAQGDQGRAKAV